MSDDHLEAPTGEGPPEFRSGKRLGPEVERRIAELGPRFPAEHRARVLALPVLHLAQQQFGYVDDEVIELVARRLELPASHVLGVATFYTMLQRKPLGRYHLQLCTNVGCQLVGAYDRLDQCRQRLGIEPGETTPDGNVTLREVECLAACGYGPVVQLAERGQPDIPLYFEQLDREKLDRLLDALESGRVPVELGT